MDYTGLDNYLNIKYAGLDSDSIVPEYEALYNDVSDTLTNTAIKVFAYWHKRINDSFEMLNSYINEGRDYLHADNSRYLLATINESREFSKKLSNYGIKTIKAYSEYMDNCLEFVVPYRGSTIPNNFPPIELLYTPIFLISNSKSNNSYMKNKKLIGEGSYAKVYKYDDANYKTKFAYKKLNKTASDKELVRFRQEFDIMKSHQYPYILSVYSYFEKQQMYIMEYMDYNLKKYIDTHNNTLDFKTRKSIALQILKSIIYLHEKGILHRDLSFNNILINEYENLLVVKICDFGLAKDEKNLITSTNTSIKGTYIDPSLEKFEDYNVKNEIYSLGFILWFVFTGKNGYKNDKSLLSSIIEKCMSPDINNRYSTVKELYNDIFSLKSNDEKVVNVTTDIKELKQKLTVYLSHFSANDVPSVCESLGLSSGEISEAFKSKSSYVSKRLYSLNREETISLISKIKERFGDDI